MRCKKCDIEMRIVAISDREEDSVKYADICYCCPKCKAEEQVTKAVKTVS